MRQPINPGLILPNCRHAGRRRGRSAPRRFLRTGARPVPRRACGWDRVLYPRLAIREKLRSSCPVTRRRSSAFPAQSTQTTPS